MMRTVRIAALSITTSLASWSIASAQNLIPNPGFDDDLSGWNFVEDEVWTPDDATGQAGSGSAEISVSAGWGPACRDRPPARRC